MKHIQCVECGAYLEFSKHEKRCSVRLNEEKEQHLHDNLEPKKEMALDVNDTLRDRGEKYGPFAGHAQITQRLKTIMRGTPGWFRCDPDQQEALEMIAHKIGRILNGDPNYDDSWRDIAGYAMLVCNRLTGEGPK
jgi:hypothetical protein